MRTLGSRIRRAHQQLARWLRAFYGMGPAAHEASGAMRELFADDVKGPALCIEQWEGRSACVVRDRVAEHRVTLTERNGTLVATACTCLPHRELAFTCRHMQAVDAAIQSPQPKTLHRRFR